MGQNFYHKSKLDTVTPTGIFFLASYFAFGYNTFSALDGQREVLALDNQEYLRSADDGFILRRVTMMMGTMGRAGMGMPGMNLGTGMDPMSGTTPMMPGMMTMPRCNMMKFEKCSGGMKITCTCQDQMACSMMQNLATMLMGGMVSCCMMLNGMLVCWCNLTMGLCQCEMMDKGMCISCTSGDPKCCEMIQACCDCLAAMMKNGCTCCLLMNNTPVCCC